MNIKLEIEEAVFPKKNGQKRNIDQASFSILFFAFTFILLCLFTSRKISRYGAVTLHSCDSQSTVVAWCTFFFFFFFLLTDIFILHRGALKTNFERTVDRRLWCLVSFKYSIIHVNRSHPNQKSNCYLGATRLPFPLCKLGLISTSLGPLGPL